MQAHVSFASPADPAVSGELLAGLSRNKINLNRLLLQRGAGSVCDFSIDQGDYLRNSAFIQQTCEALSITPSCVEPAGAITLFPHASDLSRLLRVLEVVASDDVEIGGIYSSISAVSLCTGYDQLDRVADMLLERFELPPGHSPFRYVPSELDQQLSRGPGRKVETVAQYWEPRIKIYGSTLKQGMRSYALSFPRNMLSAVIPVLSKLGPDQKFQMFSLTPDGSDGYRAQLLSAPGPPGMDTEIVLQQLGALSGVSRVKHKEVDILYLHGPHFQDRYGVAALAVNALDKGAADFSCLNCSGTSIFLVTDADGGERALASLSEVFVVP